MQGLIPVQNPPDSTMEANNPNDDDEIYKLFPNVFWLQPPKVDVEMLYFSC